MMKVFINLKSIGKRKPVLEKMPYALPDTVTNLRQLIEAVVRKETERYNSRGTDNMLVTFLTQSEIEEQCETGKVSFGRLYSETKTDPEKAVKTALVGFEDGLFRVLIGENEISDLDAPLDITEGCILTFIRLTFLAGRSWLCH